MENNTNCRLPSTIRDNEKNFFFIFEFLTNGFYRAIQIFAFYIEKYTTCTYKLWGLSNGIFRKAIIFELFAVHCHGFQVA